MEEEWEQHLWGHIFKLYSDPVGHLRCGCNHFPCSSTNIQLRCLCRYSRQFLYGRKLIDCGEWLQLPRSLIGNLCSDKQFDTYLDW